MFFLATADAQGRPDCSYKGGVPGFVSVVDATTLAFPSYDGNGQFRSLGNVSINPHVGLLFIDFEATRRIRVNGVASIDAADPLRERYPDADLVVRVRAQEIFPNCPRYIHKMQLTELSVYAPRRGHEPPAPAWKQMDVFRDYLPRGNPD
jgi:predicted pyridoxine 5'-phosphate oxidase superfamily flavin-nucleotide-binding protein